MFYSKRQRIFLVVYEFSGATNEVVLYFENTDSQAANSKCSTVKGLLLNCILISLKYLHMYVGDLVIIHKLYL